MEVAALHFHTTVATVRQCDVRIYVVGTPACHYLKTYFASKDGEADLVLSKWRLACSYFVLWLLTIDAKDAYQGVQQ